MIKILQGSEIELKETTVKDILAPALIEYDQLFILENQLTENLNSMI